MNYLHRITSLFFTLALFLSSALWAEVGSVTLLVGKAHIERGAEKLSVANGTLIEEQDKVMTEENSRVQLTFKDNTIITLGSKSHLAVNEFFLSETQAPKASFSVAQGVFKTITGQIGKVAPENFKLTTKTATIGIRGTIFEGSIGADKDLIQCIQGSIVVSSLDSSMNFAPVVVKAGEMTTVGFNAAPTPPAPIPAGESGLVLAPSSDEDSRASEAEPFVVVSNGSDDTPSSTSASEGIASYERLASVAQERQESGADESKDKALGRGDSNTSTPGKSNNLNGIVDQSGGKPLPTPQGFKAFGSRTTLGGNDDPELVNITTLQLGNRGYLEFTYTDASGEARSMSGSPLGGQYAALKGPDGTLSAIVSNIYKENDVLLQIVGGTPYTNFPTQGVALGGYPAREDNDNEFALSRYAGVNYATKDVLVLSSESSASDSGSSWVLTGKLQSDGSLTAQGSRYATFAHFGNDTTESQSLLELKGGLFGTPGSGSYILGGAYKASDPHGDNNSEVFSHKMIEKPASGFSPMVGMSANSLQPFEISSSNIASASQKAHITDKFFVLRTSDKMVVATPEDIESSEFLSWGYWKGHSPSASTGLWVAGKESAVNEASTYIQGLLNSGSSTLRYNGVVKGSIQDTSHGLIKESEPGADGIFDTTQPLTGTVDLTFRLGASQSNLNATFRFSPLHPEAFTEDGKRSLQNIPLNNLQGNANGGGFHFRDNEGTTIQGHFYGDQAQEAGGAFRMNNVGINGVFHAKKR